MRRAGWAGSQLATVHFPHVARRIACDYARGVLFQPVRCPHCQTDALLRIVWDMGILWRVFWNLVLLMLGAMPAVPLRRKCPDCGALFASSWRQRPRQGICGICEYNLTGNVSGICPECGWKIPRRLRKGLSKTTSQKRA